jgi:transposase-like protein
MSRASIASKARFSAAERARLLTLYRQSGLTQKDFAEQHGLKLTALRQWLYRPGKQAGETKPLFQELIVAPPTAGWAVEMTLGKAVTVRLSQAAVATLVNQLLERQDAPC